ncbi:hypothetical protein Sjap_008960 [Stephania japonica]|uniref:Uncharacterized protein n=1 Tax=Stephania japonica TaxID=461633 RepID=A0AAP0JQJ3_9MAGN
MAQCKGQGGLGFRNLHCMNEVLLAKQFWRLMMNTGSLLYRVLKEKYFRNGPSELGESTFRNFWHSITYTLEKQAQGDPV